MSLSSSVSKKKEFCTTHIALLFFINMLFLKCSAIDNPHFYRATLFWGEPRIDRPWLSTFQTEFAFGHATTSWNDQGKKERLLDIFGFQNMRALGQNVPTLDSTNTLDQILINLAALPSYNTFGLMSYKGSFRFSEITCIAYQNLLQGFFFQAHLPIRRLLLSKVRALDLSPLQGILSQQTPLWKDFLANFNAIFARHNLFLGGSDQTGAGDLSFLVGWAKNYNETTSLDFIDFDARIGLLLPTAKTASLTHPFALPLGYNGHSGVPLKFNISCGYLEWITVGAHLGALFLVEKNQHLRIKTSNQQTGFISLSTANATIDPGIYWDFSTYFKADHLCKGFSFLIGYTYSHKDPDSICTKNKDPLFISTAQHNSLLKSWNMHMLNFMIEFDPNRTSESSKPIITFFYDLIIAGKRIFNASTKEIIASINSTWEF